ncbi:hypothetical protein C1646_813256 [Rhizophagus diaphanus]|nr:hypothetical protein C1646_813256 [Rhizophagus diaphanus] [Rhizophagus sp. MUCL 43196]
MGDLYQNLAELKRCFDERLISDSEYQSLRTLAMNSWTSVNLPPQRQPGRSFWENLYDIAVYLKDKFMENIIEPIIERYKRLQQTFLCINDKKDDESDESISSESTSSGYDTSTSISSSTFSND